MRATEYPGHQCRCIVSDGVESDRCPVRVGNPDQPVCDRCLEVHVPLRDLTTFLRVEMAEQ